MFYEEILARYGGDPAAEDPVIQAAVADTYTSQGLLYHMLGRFADATEAYLKSCEYLENSQMQAADEKLADVLINLTLVQLRQFDPSGAAAALDEFEKRFGQRIEPEFAEQRAKTPELRSLIDQIRRATG